MTLAQDLEAVRDAIENPEEEKCRAPDCLVCARIREERAETLEALKRIEAALSPKVSL